MVGEEFERDSAKAQSNLAKHRVTFEAARRAFGDAFAFERFDIGSGGAEVRHVITGMVNGALLTVAYTERGDRTRITSARGAANNETTIVTKRQSDGTFVQVLPDGTTRPSEEQTDWSQVRELTDEEVHAAAMADPDAQPLTDAEWNAARKVPRTKTLRRALGLTQKEFAARYQIPVGTLRDWEQGKTEPDQSARAYLRAIAGDPEAVQRALLMGPTPR